MANSPASWNGRIRIACAACSGERRPSRTDSSKSLRSCESTSGSSRSPEGSTPRVAGRFVSRARAGRQSEAQFRPDSSLVTAEFANCNRFELSSGYWRVVDSRTIIIRSAMLGGSASEIDRARCHRMIEGDAGQNRNSSGLECRRIAGVSGASSERARESKAERQAPIVPPLEPRTNVLRMGVLDSRGEEGLGGFAGGPCPAAHRSGLLVFIAPA